MNLVPVLAFLLLAAPANRVKDNQQWADVTRQGKEAIRAKNYVDAERLLKRALEVANTMSGEDPKGFATSKENLAVVYVEQGQFAKAEKILLEAMAVREARADEDPLEMSRKSKNVGDVLLASGKTAKAEAWYQKAVDLYFEVPAHEGPDHKERADYMHRLAVAQAANKKADAAIALFPKSREEYAKNPNGTRELEDMRFLVRSLTGQADACVMKGKLDDAEPLYRRALETAEENFPREPFYASQLELTAKFLRKKKAVAEAAQLEAKAKEVRSKKDYEE